jgi:outer membrane lipoprotein
MSTRPLHRCIALPALATLLAALLLGGCASQVPLLIRQAPPGNPALVQVRAQVDDYVGQTVRWGGLLIATDNQERSSRLTVLAWPLGSDGMPGYSDDSDGRFIAIVPAFLDPAVYAADRLVTVTGTLVRSETGLVGEHPYAYPVVEAQAWYLWPAPAAAPRGHYRYPGWYDPWYGPSWYSPWYDPWYSPGWYYPYRYPYWRPHVHPKPAQGGFDGKHPHPGPDGRPHRDGPRKLGVGAERPRQQPRTVEQAPPRQEKVMDRSGGGRQPAGDGGASRGYRR